MTFYKFLRQMLIKSASFIKKYVDLSVLTEKLRNRIAQLRPLKHIPGVFTRLDKKSEEGDIRSFCNAMGYSLTELVAQNRPKLKANNSLFDAIIQRNGQKCWLEHTEIAKNQETFNLRDEIHKTNEKKVFLGPSGPLKLFVEPMYDAIKKKAAKKYQEAAQLFDLGEKGVLLIMFKPLDPFWDDEYLEKFLLDLRSSDNEYDYQRVVAELKSSCFHTVYFGTFVGAQNRPDFSLIWRK